MKKFASIALMVISVDTMALPTIVEFDAHLNQHQNDSPLCLGDGMSSKLTSEVGVKGIWLTGKYLQWYLGYSKEHCMLNDRSKDAGKYQMGLKYQWAL